MTTAHRPTWKAAVGKAQEGGWTAGGAKSTNRSILDAPSHTKLKTRHDASIVTSSDKKEEILKQSLYKIQQMEALHGKGKKNNYQSQQHRKLILEQSKVAVNKKIEEESMQKLLMSENDVDEVKLQSMYDDADDNDNSKGEDGDVVKDVMDQESDLDANSDFDDDDDSDEDSDDSDDDDFNDEEDLLQAELAKIKAERMQKKQKEEMEKQREEEEKMEEAALIGNPLLLNNDLSNSSHANAGKVKRKWNDDVVFRNQAKGEAEGGGKKRFINDTVRNDFHKRFLNKFIK